MAVAPISVCLIVKNEENQIGRCLESIRPYVREICVVDTGSSDKTPDIVKKYADKFETFTKCNDSDGLIEDFSLARNRSFELATQPWIMWVDGDDEVQGAENLLSIVQKYDGQGPCLIMFPYEYAHDHHGNVTCIQYRERLASPKSGFKWKGPVHEVLNPEIPNTVMHKVDDVKFVHRRQQSGKVVEHNRNLRILKRHYAKIGESDVRQLYYLGLEYGNSGDIGNAIKYHKRYIELSNWDDEKFLACLKVTEHYQSLGQYEDAIQWGLKTLTMREGWAESYFSLAKSFYFIAQQGGPEELRNWQKSVHFAKLGLERPETETILFVNPLERKYDIHRFLNVALNKVGDTQGALDSAKKGLEFRPDDEALTLNKGLYEEYLCKNKLRECASTLLKLKKITPGGFKSIDDIIEGKITTSSEETHSDVSKSESLDIVFFVGPGAEPWNPETIESNGMGGSETAAMEMAKQLSKLGHNVIVYSDCENLEGVFDSVKYIHHTKCKGISCDVFITSRRPHIMEDKYDISATIKMCWVHDVHLGSGFTHTQALKIDRFLTLSNWHKDFFLNAHDFVHPDQVLVTRNGINIDRFLPCRIDRNRHKAVYSSSPDRGLDVAIRAWPEVRKIIPDAELHVFYGFKNWTASATQSGDKGQLDLIEYLKKQLVEHEKHGVVFHDRVDQNRLAKEFLSAGVWAYPTWFSETSCISAMEAQAAGLRMVTSPIAALNETVGDRGVMISGDWLSQDYMDSWVNAVVDAMKKPGNDDRIELQRYARNNFGWEALAKEWDAMIRKVIEDVERDIVPPYKASV